MPVSNLSGSKISSGLTIRSDKWKRMRNISGSTTSIVHQSHVGKALGGSLGKAPSCYLSVEHLNLLSPLVKHYRKSRFPVVQNHLSSDSALGGAGGKECLGFEEEHVLSKSSEEDNKLERSFNNELHAHDIKSEAHDIKSELITLSVPAIAGQAIEPLAQLMETAYIGRLGPLELGSAGISIAIFNNISKLFNIPLLSVATSFVAEDISKNATKSSFSEGSHLTDHTNGRPIDVLPERKQLSSVSTALLLALCIGIFEAAALFLGSGTFLSLMGISLDSPMHIPAKRFLRIRALGAPANVLALAIQGIFRGFKDTKTPVVCLAIGNLSAVVFLPLLMYHFGLGVVGAAISTVLSQYIIAFVMLWYLSKRVILLPPKVGALQFGVYMKSGGFLIGRTLASLTTMTLATSLAARQGAVAMAAHQICLQIWLAVSLLLDSLAASSQALIASSLSEGDYKTVKEVANFALKIGLLGGLFLALVLGFSFSSIAPLFSKDADVLGVVRTGILFVCASQPINGMAFIFDGLHYGVSDFPFAAVSMMSVSLVSSLFMLYATPKVGLPGVWMGLVLFMGLRALAGCFRLLSKSGPWWFMHKDWHTVKVA